MRFSGYLYSEAAYMFQNDVFSPSST